MYPLLWLAEADFSFSVQLSLLGLLFTSFKYFSGRPVLLIRTNFSTQSGLLQDFSPAHGPGKCARRGPFMFHVPVGIQGD